ncbi:hypothetical protein J6590_007734 [Homalodisca vitripennis]|nr:hypothetical protein J6590_007734 [Homalodisca vitripennis]
MQMSEIHRVFQFSCIHLNEIPCFRSANELLGLCIGVLCRTRLMQGEIYSWAEPLLVWLFLNQPRPLIPLFCELFIRCHGPVTLTPDGKREKKNNNGDDTIQTGYKLQAVL